MKTKVFLLLFFLFLSNASYGTEDPFAELRDTALYFFKPMKGTVLSAENGLLRTGLNESDGIKAGMRLSVLREGAPYNHPLTGQRIGMLETPVGLAEVSEVDSEGASLILLKGTASAGDILRVSSAKVRTLFYQSSEVNWGISEKYYETLKGSGRFEMIDPQVYEENSLLAEAKRLGADIILMLTEEEAEGVVLLRQRLLWKEDMKVFSLSEVKVPEGYVSELRLAEEFFLPKKEALLSFDMPFPVRFLRLGDIDGNGKDELVLSTGKDIVFYSIDRTLKPALDGAEIKGGRNEEHIWLDTLDIDGDKKAEVLVTLMKAERVMSCLYAYKDTAFSRIGKWDFFVRAIEGNLYGQRYSPAQGFEGKVFPVRDGAEFSPVAPAASMAPVEVPEDINLYDFVFLDSEEAGRLVLAYDEGGYMNLYNLKGFKLWQSEKSYGGPLQKFKLEPPTVMVEPGQWSVKDRLSVMAGRVIALRRIPVTGVAPGFGYKSSGLMALRLSGMAIEELSLVQYIPGNALDYAVGSENVFVVSESVKFKNVLKGMGVMGNRLYAFPLRDKRDVIVR